MGTKAEQNFLKNLSRRKARMDMLAEDGKVYRQEKWAGRDE